MRKIAARGAAKLGAIRAVPVTAVAMNMLVRDRVPDDVIDLTVLCDSIRELGLLSPIRVMARSDGQGYELVHGARRLRAYIKLAEDAGGGLQYRLEDDTLVLGAVLPTPEGLIG